METATIGSDQHVQSAIERLRLINEKGAAHRDFMQASIDEIESREQQLRAQLAIYEAEKTSVREHSAVVGNEYSTRTKQLTRAALNLITANSDEITDRGALWQIVSEGSKRHYASSEDRIVYAETLTRLDEILRIASSKDKSLPILIADPGYKHTEELLPVRVDVFHSDPETNGLSITANSIDDLSPHVMVKSPPSSYTMPIQSYLNRRLEVYDKNISVDKEETKIMIGAQAITSYSAWILSVGSDKEAYDIAIGVSRAVPEVGANLEKSFKLRDRFGEQALKNMSLLNFDNPKSLSEYRILRGFIADDNAVKNALSTKYAFPEDAVHKYKLFESLAANITEPEPFIRIRGH